MNDQVENKLGKLDEYLDEGFNGKQGKSRVGQADGG